MTPPVLPLLPAVCPLEPVVPEEEPVEPGMPAEEPGIPGKPPDEPGIPGIPPEDPGIPGIPGNPLSSVGSVAPFTDTLTSISPSPSLSSPCCWSPPAAPAVERGIGEPSVGIPRLPVSPSLLELLLDELDDEREDCDPARLELGMLGTAPGRDAVAPGRDGVEDELPGEPLDGIEGMLEEDELLLLLGIDGLERLLLDDDEEEEEDDELEEAVGIEGEDELLEELCC